MLTEVVLQGKATRNAWQKEVDAGLTQKEAEDKYIELGEKLIKEHLA